MKETREHKVEEMLKDLRSDPNSYLNRLETCKVPQTDAEFMHLWRLFFMVSTLKDLRSELILNKYSVQFSELDKFGVLTHLKTYLQGIAQQRLDALNAELSFQPRIQTYLDQFSEQEQKNLSPLLMYVLSCNDELDGYTKSFKLDDVLNRLPIEYHWVIGLSSQSPFFSDGILLLSDRNLDLSKPFIHYEFRVCAILQKFFWGHELTDEELVNLKSMKIPSLFGIDPDFNRNVEQVIDTQNQETDSELPDIDQVFEELQEKRDNLPVKNQLLAVNPNEEQQLETFDNDQDYLEMESKWIIDQMKLMDILIGKFRVSDESAEVIRNRVAIQRKECEIKLARAKERGFIPALIYFQQRYRLTDDELNVLKLLVITSWSSFFKIDDLAFSIGIRIKDVINTFFETVGEKFNAQKLFNEESTLVRVGLIHLEQQGLDENILDSKITIDNILLHYLIGVDFNLGQLMKGGKVYTPEETLEDLEMNDKEAMRMRFINQPKVELAKQQLDLPILIKKAETRFHLFVGEPGTGKTLAANSMAHELGKNILTVNLNIIEDVVGMMGKKESIFSILFREAANKNAILFFDESEQLLMHRMNDLLVYSNSFDVVVIFATNAEFKIDDALRDRIGPNITFFKAPGPESRFRILKKHLPMNIEVPADDALRKLALQIKLNGRQIKNMVNAAISYAVEDHDETAIHRLGIEHLQRAATDQRKSKVFNSKLETSVIPRKGLDEGIFDHETSIELGKLANFYNARKVLQNEWGFNDDRDLSTGNIVLFHGPSGVGKTLAAEMIAYEIGKSLRVVNYAQIMSKWVGETEKNIDQLLTEIHESDSVLLFDEADGLFSKRTEVNGSSDRFSNSVTNLLLARLEQVDSLVILTTNHFGNIDPAFHRRMQILEFRKPDYASRIKLWQNLIPDQVPLEKGIQFEQLAIEFDSFTGGDIKKAIILACRSKAIMLGAEKLVTQEDLRMACLGIGNKNNKEKIGFVR